MAANICTSCLRTASRQRTSIPRVIRASPRFTVRSFTTTPWRFAETAPTHTSRSASKDAQPEQSTIGTAASELNKIHGGTMDTYASYGATEILYKECANQAPYSIPKGKDGEEVTALDDGTQLGVGEGWWYTELGLQPTFTAWTQVTMLHMYLISARFRCFEPDVCKTWQQNFIDHFFTDAENRMIVNHDLESRGTRNGYLKDLFLQWRGILVAYDEGLMKGDAVLAAAVWRNLYNANPDVDIKQLAMIVSFMRKTLKELEATPDITLVGGALKFGKPADEAKLVGLASGMMSLPLEQAPGTPLPPTSKKS